MNTLMKPLKRIILNNIVLTISERIAISTSIFYHILINYKAGTLWVLDSK